VIGGFVRGIDSCACPRRAIRRSERVVLFLAKVSVVVFTSAFLTGFFSASRARAFTFDFSTEFDKGLSGSFATADVIENDGDLVFDVAVTDSLGSSADLHVFYLNLVDDFSGLSVVDDDSPNIPYMLLIDPSVAGGAGADFDFGVSFGNGAGKKGNGVLRTAHFVISADEPLSIADMFEVSYASGGRYAASVALHVQGTSLVKCQSSETVGGTVVPEPSSAVLLASGLISLYAGRRRFRAKALLDARACDGDTGLG
jgi:hypothetical protein